MPKGKGLNSYITVEHHKFFTIDDAVKLTKPGYFLAKIDLHHVYRSIPLYPSSFKATGLKWKFTNHSNFTHLFDTRLSFGASSSPSIFHKVTQSVEPERFSWYLSLSWRFPDCCPHGTGVSISIWHPVKTTVGFGFRLSEHKVTPPTQCLPFIGIEINTHKCTLKVPSRKLQELNLLSLPFFINTLRLNVNFDS